MCELQRHEISARPAMIGDVVKGTKTFIGLGDSILGVRCEGRR